MGNNEFLLSNDCFFFKKLAVVSLAGPMPVLAYMAQTVVQDHGWITYRNSYVCICLLVWVGRNHAGAAESGHRILVDLLAGLRRQGPWGVAVSLPELLTCGSRFYTLLSMDDFSRDRISSYSAQPRLGGLRARLLPLSLAQLPSVRLVSRACYCFERSASHAHLGVPLPRLSSFDPVAARWTLIAAVLMLACGFGCVDHGS